MVGVGVPGSVSDVDGAGSLDVGCAVAVGLDVVGAVEVDVGPLVEVGSTVDVGLGSLVGTTVVVRVLVEVDEVVVSAPPQPVMPASAM